MHEIWIRCLLETRCHRVLWLKCSLWQSCAQSESPTVSCINALGPLWVCRNARLQMKVRRVSGQGTFIYSNCWFVAQKCRYNSLGFIFDGPSNSASIQDLKFFHLVSMWKAQEDKHLFMILHLMCICFGSPSVRWLWLGSMWCPWPFLTLAEGCCDQLCGRLSVSHWGLVFKWQTWRWCQDCYTHKV